MTLTRRTALGAGIMAAGAGLCVADPSGAVAEGGGGSAAGLPDAASLLTPEPAFGLPETAADPALAAQDEAFWAAVAALFDVTDEVTHLEHGNWGMMARPTLAAHLAAVEMVNRRGSFYARREFGADARAIRAQAAGLIGAAPEEVVFTRNASEAMQALIGGYNRLAPGDGVLIADLDYGAMRTAMAWLETRRGAKIVDVALPEPATPEAALAAYEGAIAANPHVRLALLTHVSHRTGALLPVREIVAAARARGIDVLLDSAHALGQVPLVVDDLGADFIGFNLHKWIGAPIGVGMIYIRQSRIADIDPFMGEPARAPDDIDARVHTGTSDFAALLAVPTALALHHAIGPERIAARLRHLRDLWAEPARALPGLEVLTPPDPRAHAGITAFRLAGRTTIEDNVALARRLLDEFAVFTVMRDGLASGACVRVTPGVMTPPAACARLLEALKVISA